MPFSQPAPSAPSTSDFRHELRFALGWGGSNSAMRVSASEAANLPGSKLKTQGIADFGHSWYQHVATLQFFSYPIWTHTHLMCGFKRGCKQQKHQGVKACQVFVFFWVLIFLRFPGISLALRLFQGSRGSNNAWQCPTLSLTLSYIFFFGNGNLM